MFTTRIKEQFPSDVFHLNYGLAEPRQSSLSGSQIKFRDTIRRLVGASVFSSKMIHALHFFKVLNWLFKTPQTLCLLHHDADADDSAGNGPGRRRCAPSGRGSRRCTGWSRAGSPPPRCPSAATSGSRPGRRRPSPRRLIGDLTPPLCAARAKAIGGGGINAGQKWPKEKKKGCSRFGCQSFCQCSDWKSITKHFLHCDYTLRLTPFRQDAELYSFRNQKSGEIWFVREILTLFGIMTSCCALLMEPDSSLPIITVPMSCWHKRRPKVKTLMWLKYWWSTWPSS